MIRYILFTIFIVFLCLSFIVGGSAGLGIILLLFYTIISIIMFLLRDLSDKQDAKRIGRINYYADKEYSKMLEKDE